MVLGSNLFNLGQFVYHFLVGRYLGKEIYGDFAAILSILGIIGMFQSAISLTIVRFVATKKNDSEISAFARWISKWSFFIALFTLLVLLGLASTLASFLNLTEQTAAFLIAPIVFIFILTNTFRSILQGTLKFAKFITSMLLESISKIILTLILVTLGLGLLGALFGFIFGSVIALVTSFIFVLNYLSTKKEQAPNLKPLFSYTTAVFIQGLSLTSMYSTDIILVKHFLSAADAGIYASLSVLGRIVFYGITPITNVMFPLIAKRFNLGHKYSNLFYLSLIMISIISLGLNGIFYFFPKIPILVLFGSNFIEGAKYLWYFGIFMSLLALSSHLTQFYLSLNKTIVVWFFAAAAITQIILILLFHIDILGIIKISILCTALLAFSLLIYFPYSKVNHE